MTTLTPTAHFAIDRILSVVWPLYAAFPMIWRYAPETPTDPLHAVPAEDWPVWDQEHPHWLQKRQPNWFYATLTYPEALCGVALADSEARIFINGYAPFTLWVDGQEVFAEDHIWKATGPIADPLVEPIRPGQTVRLVLCLEPTEVPNNSPLMSVGVQARRPMELAVDLAAAVLQLRVGLHIANGDTERAVLEKAAALLDLTALEEQNWPVVLASITAMEDALAPLSSRAKALTVHLIGHTHIDMDWMWTWPDTVHCARRDFKAITDMMDDDPEVTFTLSQVPLYRIVEEMDPDVFAKVQARMREGRWENAVGTWVEGDLNMADGESIARHILYAKQWTREHLGSEARVLWEPDTFGHPGNMPQLAKLGEFDCYFHWRSNPGRDNNWPVRIWEGVDGTPIYAFSTCYGSNLQPEAVLHNLAQYLDFGLHDALHVWGLGDHGGGLPRFQREVLERYRHKPLVPTMCFSTMAKLRASIANEHETLRRNVGETYSLFEGCFTTHAGIKRENRACEGALLAAETFSALAGLDRRAALREAWTKTLFNHFHDIFDGAAVHDSYLDATRRSLAALETADAVIGEGVDALAMPGYTAITLYNPLGFVRCEPVCSSLPTGTTALIDGEGTRIPVQSYGEQFIFITDNIPAFAQKTYSMEKNTVTESTVAVREDDTYFFVETATATLTICKASGAIGSYVDKSLGCELVGYGVQKTLTHVPSSRADLALNVFQILDEAPNLMSAWLVNDILREENLLRGATVRLLETGPVFARFQVSLSFRASHLEEEIIIYQTFPRVDFQAKIDWREQGSPLVGIPQLKVSFATTMSAARARYEGPFFVTERPADGLDQPTQKWAALSGDEFGFALLNDCKYGVDALGGRLRMTLLRNSYGPDPDSDNGEHHVRFAFQPYAAASNAELVRAGMAYNRPLVSRLTGETVDATEPFVRISGADSVVCTTLRHAEYTDRMLLRLFETAGTPCCARVFVGQGISEAESVNFLEHATGEAIFIADGWASVEFHPFEVKTLLVR